jgi:hypothetical protein
MKKRVAIVVLLAAAGVWGYRLGTAPGSGESALRDTGGMETTALSVQPAERGHLVLCRIVNQQERFAEQVVLRVALMDATGKTLAVNPLVGASAVAPGETRELAVLVAAPPHAGPVRAQVETSLVRWHGKNR